MYVFVSVIELSVSNLSEEQCIHDNAFEDIICIISVTYSEIKLLLISIAEFRMQPITYLVWSK